MIVCNIVKHRDMLALHGWIYELERIRNLSRVDRLRLFDREAELMSNIAAKIHWHVPPLVALGQGRGSLPLKFRAVLHSLGLISKDRATLSALVRSIVSWHSDYGTEIGLARLAPTTTDAILPYTHAPDPDADPSRQVSLCRRCVLMTRKARPSCVSMLMPMPRMTLRRRQTVKQHHQLFRMI